VAAKSKPEVWKNKDGQTRLVRGVEDQVKARFDGFRKSTEKAPATPSSTNTAK
jgi:hypothetical protein